MLIKCFWKFHLRVEKCWYQRKLTYHTYNNNMQIAIFLMQSTMAYTDPFLLQKKPENTNLLVTCLWIDLRLASSLPSAFFWSTRFTITWRPYSGTWIQASMTNYIIVICLLFRFLFLPPDCVSATITLSVRPSVCQISLSTNRSSEHLLYLCYTTAFKLTWLKTRK